MKEDFVYCFFFEKGQSRVEKYGLIHDQPLSSAFLRNIGNFLLPHVCGDWFDRLS